MFFPSINPLPKPFSVLYSYSLTMIGILLTIPYMLHNVGLAGHRSKENQGIRRQIHQEKAVDAIRKPKPGNVPVSNCPPNADCCDFHFIKVGQITAHSHKKRTVSAPSNKPVILSDLPDFIIQPGNYRVDPYICAAAALQALGKDQACKTLFTLSRDKPKGDRIMILCRMLFTKKKNADFRGLMVGRLFFSGHTNASDWPLEPIALVEGVPFLITTGYEIEGILKMRETT